MPRFGITLDLIFPKPLVKERVKQIVDKKSYGVYFWFADQEALLRLGIPFCNHRLYTYNVETNWYYLVYIGICPRDENTKKQFLRERIVDCHLGNKICNSTFRQSLSALLRNHKPYIKKSGKKNKIYIQEDEEEEITNFIEKHFVLGVQYHNTPWDIEKELIEKYNPPINLTHNIKGWFYDNMSASREIHRESAENYIFKMK
jgi:hypothetical protein